jgi:hypothetical protein
MITVLDLYGVLTLVAVKNLCKLEDATKQPVFVNSIGVENLKSSSLDIHFNTFSAVCVSHKKFFFVNNSERREGVAGYHVGVTNVKMTMIT